jgi:hypothetical protein
MFVALEMVLIEWNQSLNTFHRTDGLLFLCFVADWLQFQLPLLRSCLCGGSDGV